MIDIRLIKISPITPLIIMKYIIYGKKRKRIYETAIETIDEAKATLKRIQKIYDREDFEIRSNESNQYVK